MHELPEQPTWSIHDSTKIQTYMRCPRRYFYEYVLGWKPKAESIHLVFGNAWHFAQEVLLSEGYTAEACLHAYNAFLDHFRKFFPANYDDLCKPKTPENVLRALPQYCNQFSTDPQDFEVLHLETTGTIAVSETQLLHFKADAICEGDEGIFILEHKTSTRFSTTWAAQWRQKFQIGTYSHALFCLYDAPSVYGIKVNGAFFTEEPKLKRDGTPYAGARDNEFHRIPVRRNIDSMQSWLIEALDVLNRIERDFARMSEVSESLDHLPCFLRNTEACTDFGGCPFLDYCSVWHNPLRQAAEPPVTFAVSHWDPRNVAKPNAHKVEV